MIVIIAIGFFLYNKGIPNGGGSSLNKAESTIVFVYEFQDKTDDQVILLNDIEEFIAANGLSGWRQWDKDLPSAKPYVDFAAKKDLSPPVMFYQTGKDIKKVAKFTGSKSDLEAFVK